MKKVEAIGHQGDVVIYKLDEFPEGERTQDELTKNNQLALGELSGHNHYFEDGAAVDLFKLPQPEYNGLTFINAKKDAILTHGLIKGFKGREADKDYHSEVKFKGGEKYVIGIVQETDWLSKTVRRVQD